MPRFSVIVTVHQASPEQLHAALTSVLGQRFADLELIAVDEASSGTSDQVIRGYAAADHRLVRVRLPYPAGPGAARNAALERARGTYVLFLDGTDTLAPGALPAIDARLRATGDPQLLLFRDTTGDDRRGLYSQQPPEVMTLADRPGLLWPDPAAHTRAHRRELLDRLGLRFPPGHEAHLPFGLRALLAAGSLAVLDRCCVRRPAAPARPPRGREHLDVLRQYDRLFATVTEPRWRAALYHRMVAHLTELHQRPGLLPPATRAEFFRRAAALCARHRVTSGATALTDVRSRTRSLPVLARRLRATTARTVRRAVRFLLPRLAACGRGVRAAAFHLHYRCHLLRPLRPELAVFLPATGAYTGHPAALEATARALAPHLRTVWVAGPEHAPHLPDGGPRRLHPHSPATARALARARYLVSDAPFPGPVPRAPRTGQVRLQTHTGTPIARPHGPDGPADLPALLRQIDCWTAALSAGPHATRTARHAYPGAYTLLEYGSPQADRLVTATDDDVRAVRARLGIPEEALVLLYAPAERPYEPAPAIPRLDVPGLAARLGPRHLLLTHAPEAPPADGSGRSTRATGRPSLIDLCLAADVLITDYHPVIFDYALLDRPIVVHAEDWTDYRTARGVCLELPDCPPGPVTRTEDELLALLTDPARPLWNDPAAARRRAAFRARFSPGDDGRAAERVVREVFLDGRSVPPVTPPAGDGPRPEPGAAHLRQPHAHRVTGPEPRRPTGPVPARQGGAP
ncbi:bifunctional glycosyltransferase/CDP-glycerol:glycerophosphate glycerophosphotransferase [Streptomyces xiamenensis]